MTTTSLLWNPPLLNYFHYKTGDEVGQLADGATVDFFKASDHAIRQDTYSDPEGTTVNSNPLEASAVGSLPPIYMQDEKYYIVIKDKYGNIIETIDNAIPNGGSGSGGDTAKQDENLLSNGQFSYPVDFSESEDTPGLISQSGTTVALGWGFSQDPSTTTKNIVTFNAVALDDISANPINEIQLESYDVQVGESLKDFEASLGFVNAFEGEELTFSFQMQNKGLGTIPVELLLYKRYGIGGSDPEYISITTFLVASTREQYSVNYTMPTNAGKTISDNGGEVQIVLRVGLGQTCTVGLTNALALKGTIASPVMPEMSSSEYRSKSLAESFGLSQAGLSNNYSYIKQIKGAFVSSLETGQIKVFTINKQPTNFHRCDGSTLNVKDYTIPYISNRRLFNEIGNTYGGSGELLVTSSGSLVKFDSVLGARQNSDYTSGTLGAKVTITNTKVGLKTGGSCILHSTNTIRYTFYDNFAPTEESGTGFICGWSGTTTSSNTFTSTNVSAGSPTTKSVFDLTFNDKKISDYKTSSAPLYYSSALGWQSTTSNGAFIVSLANAGSEAPANLINFSVDGKSGQVVTGKEVTITVPFLSTKSLEQNVQIFIDTINNPFEWTVKFNAVPSAGEYFEYSSQSIDYYPWYQVDGVGTDPAVAGRTGIMVSINSTDTTDLIAQKTATTLNDLTFDLPTSATHLPVIPAGGLTKLDWYISF